MAKIIDFAGWGNALYTGKKSYDIVGKKRIWFGVSIVLVIIFGILLIKPGLNLGIEFKGGSQFTISETKTKQQSLASDVIHKYFANEQPSVSTLGSNSMLVQTKTLSNTQVESIRKDLAKAYGVTEKEVTSTYIGASWGADVSQKAIQGSILFMILATIAMAIYFRAWRMAVAALVALLHDLIITIGIYAVLGWEVTPATLIGFLTILGYSIYDTVVVFDKVRENTKNVFDQTAYTYEEAANLAVNQTLVRSINTSVVALLPVTSILFIGSFLLGAGTLRDISLALFVGMAAGTFSSIFIATPLEVWLRSYEKKVKTQKTLVLQKRSLSNGNEDSVNKDSSVAYAAMKPGAHLGNKRRNVKRKK